VVSETRSNLVILSQRLMNQDRVTAEATTEIRLPA
jgi:hypothetical protein